MRTRLISTVIAGAICGAAGLAVGAAAQDKPAEQLRFKTPEEALAGLLEAVKARDMARLRAIFGVEPGELGSGDEVQDRHDLREFAANLTAAAKLHPEGDDRAILEVGTNAYEFPVPLVRKDGMWFFDTAAGKEEMLNRRIGENEFRTIAVCRGYVSAQREYRDEDWDGDGVMEYAQRIASTPGQKDGLYWDSAENAPASPLGALVADAVGEGYGKSKPPAPAAATQPATRPGTQPAGPRPYHGYFFKILRQQGDKAPGGKFDYVINGNMVAGFALVAWPAQWGNSGVMTFVVNANGHVYQKNLGEKTANLVDGMVEYNPDDGWTRADD
jgi:hypothetical protein